MNDEKLRKEFEEIRLKAKSRLIIILALIFSIILISVFSNFIRYRIEKSNMPEPHIDTNNIVDTNLNDVDDLEDNNVMIIEADADYRNIDFNNLYISQSKYNYINRDFINNNYIKEVSGDIYYIERSQNLHKIIEYNIKNDTKSIIYKEKNLDLLSSDNSKYISFIDYDSTINKNVFKLIDVVTKDVYSFNMQGQDKVLSYVLIGERLFYSLSGQSHVYVIDIYNDKAVPFNTPIKGTNINIELLDNGNLYISTDGKLCEYDPYKNIVVSKNNTLSYNINNNKLEIHVEETMIKDPKVLLIMNGKKIYNDYAYYIKKDNEILYICDDNHLYLYDLYYGDHIESYSIDIEDLISSEFIYLHGKLYVLNNSDGNISIKK